MDKPYAVIIEDDPLLAKIYVTAFQQAGFETGLDTNGNQYAALLAARPPDLVILDLHLPYASGADLLSEIRARHPKAIIAVLTADFIKAKSLPEGADHILIKPVGLTQLQKLAEEVKERLPKSKPLAIIVEDDPQLNKIFTLSLQEDFTTETFSDGDSALERLSQVKPRILLLDLHLPGATGSRILAHVRADERLRDVTVLLCTADDRQAEALQDQADFVLLKPVSPIQLRQLAARLK
jgi:DNA-binding response OmpR family regulator